MVQHLKFHIYNRQNSTYWKKGLKIPKGQSETTIEEDHATQWPNEKGQKDESTKHYTEK